MGCHEILSEISSFHANKTCWNFTPLPRYNLPAVAERTPDRTPTFSGGTERLESPVGCPYISVCLSVSLSVCSYVRLNYLFSLLPISPERLWTRYVGRRCNTQRARRPLTGRSTALSLRQIAGPRRPLTQHLCPIGSSSSSSNGK